MREQQKEVRKSSSGPSPYLRCREVQEKTGISRSTIYRLMKAGEFPSPYRLSKGRVGWKLAEVEEWLDSRECASSHG